MPKFVAEKLILSLVKSKVNLQAAKVLILGITFKENCPDIRNSKVVDLIRILEDYGTHVDIIDPHASPQELRNEQSLELKSSIDGPFHAIILAVNHNEFQAYSADFLRSHLIDNGILFDLKNNFLKDDRMLKL